MKKKLISIVILVALTTLVLSVTTVGAATRKLSLLNATVGGGKGGAVFTFKVWGDFDGFTGFVWDHGKHFDLNCNLKASDGSILICRVVGSPSMGNKNVQVVVNGFSFYPFVEVGLACNPVYDVPYNVPVDVSLDVVGVLFDPTWWNYGNYCTEEQPELGDKVWLDSFYPVGTWEYIYRDGGFCGPDGSWNNFGEAWYWNIVC
jgi:hypothetical protein